MAPAPGPAQLTNCPLKLREATPLLPHTPPYQPMHLSNTVAWCVTFFGLECGQHNGTHWKKTSPSRGYVVFFADGCRFLVSPCKKNNDPMWCFMIKKMLSQYSQSRNVHMFVCLFVCVYICLFIFKVAFNGVFAPTSRSQMSNIFRDSESLGKSNGKKIHFCVFLVHPTVLSVLLSTSDERCFVSRIRDFFFIPTPITLNQ